MDQTLTMKRTEFRKSLLKIKKAFDKTEERIICDEPSADTRVHQNFCTCKDAQDHPKTLYATRKEAQEERDHLNLKNLRIYPCPSEKGWHLTKA